MINISRVLLPLAVALFVAGCSSVDTPSVGGAFEKSSELLSNLSGHTVTYENTATNALHTDTYCAPNELRTEANVANGDWSVSANKLTTNPTVGTAYILTTNDAAGTLVKGTEVYKTDKADEFIITRIADELNCLVPAK